VIRIIGKAVHIVNCAENLGSLNCFGTISFEDCGGRLQVINIARRHFSG
jgi:hypothetical protein